MKTINLFPPKTSPCIFVLAFSCIMATSCIKDADDDEQPAPPDNNIPAVTTDSATVVIDSIFHVTTDYMRGEWMSQYEGYDRQQSASLGKDIVSRIQRLVYFSEEGIYDSHVQGITDVSDTITRFKEFEHEHGTFTFDVERQMMVYNVEYDSLLNFGTNILEYHPGKMQGPSILKQYQERIWFSKEKDGKRDWIRTDDNLMAPDDHSARLIYSMKNGQ